MTPGNKAGIVLTVLAVAAAAATAVTWAQGTAQPAGSLGALTDEVRQLRLAIEDSAKSQTQIQAMTVYLSATQSRMGQVSARLEKAHADTMAATAELQASSERWNELQRRLAGNITPQDRADLAEYVRALKAANDGAAEREGQARIRENELLAMFQTEETRWQELIARLEALVKR